MKEIDINKCFADDSGQYPNNKEKKYKFWENFEKININVWEKGCPKIYNYSESYDSLPDPDVNSYNLYETHINLWNKQYKRFEKKLTNNIMNIERHGRCRCELITQDKKIILGSDSIMNIYWHRTSGDMPNVMEEVKESIENSEKHKKFCPQIIEIKYKEFIKNYLKQANTIGGFIVFPRHNNSINQRRGRRPIDDRFDLTLECIRRAYKKEYFTNDNPLFEISEEDKTFFKMFGNFENYVNFFCLNSWVKEDYSAVYDLLSDDKNKTLPTERWPVTDKILPQNSKEWWVFYENIMSHLDARNEQIKKLFENK